jgi:hypothetical protein
MPSQNLIIGTELIDAQLKTNPFTMKPAAILVGAIMALTISTSLVEYRNFTAFDTLGPEAAVVAPAENVERSPFTRAERMLGSHRGFGRMSTIINAALDFLLVHP